MIDDPFWCWALIVVFIIVMVSYVYIIVFSKSSKRLQKRMAELNQSNDSGGLGDDQLTSTETES